MLKKLFNTKTLTTITLVSALTILFGAVGFAETLSEYITNLTNTIRSISVVFITLAAVVTAVLYLVGAANPAIKTKGKDALIALIIGVIILILSGDIANWIGNIAGKSVDTDGSIKTEATTPNQ